MTASELLSIEKDLRRRKEELVKSHGFKNLRAYYKAKDELVQSLPDDFTFDLGEYVASVELNHVRTYPASKAVITDTKKSLKLHSKR